MKRADSNTSSSREFSVADAIEIQKEHLAQWKELLKPKVYKDLEKWATAKNHLKKTGYDVMRGSSLDNYIANYKNSYTPQN